MPYIGFSYPPPYGDCGSYPEDAYEEDGNYYCFRPLTGIMVLISTPYRWRKYAMDFTIREADFIFPLFS